jgi:mycofactocin precursor
MSTSENNTPDAAATRPEDARTDPPADQEVVEELLVEEVSIDGMCGVY